jgi:hypothetical protein
MKVKLIRSNSVLVCVRCRIHRYLAAPFKTINVLKIRAPLRDAAKLREFLDPRECRNNDDVTVTPSSSPISSMPGSE